MSPRSSGSATTPSAWLPDVIGPLERLGRERGQRVDEVLVAIERLAVTAGDERAAGDIATLIARRSRDGVETVPSSVSLAERVRSDGAMSRGSFVDAVERSLVAAGRRAGDILPGGLPPTWLGANFEVHGLPTSARASVSFAAALAR